jgi:hypothetical protein
VGHGWDERFEAVLGDPRVQVRVLAPAVPADVDLPAAFEACNAEVQRVAVERAAQLGCEVRLLAVWDGRPGDGRGGTADFVRAWERTGARADVVPLPAPTPLDGGPHGA